MVFLGNSPYNYPHTELVGMDDNDAVRETYAQKVVAHFETMCGESIADSIEDRRIYTYPGMAVPMTIIAAEVLAAMIGRGDI